jgi:hypothetical protein
MLPNEEFALACREWYAEQGLIVDETNGEFAHCPYPEGMGDTGYYLLHEHHQHQGLLQSKDVGRCCFFIGHARRWLTKSDCWPNNFFDLWDIYDQFAGETGSRCARENRGIFDPKYEDKIHNTQVETGRRLAKSGSGIHDPDYRNSSEYKEINRDAGIKGGTAGKHRNTGIHDPVYRSSPEYYEMRSRVGKDQVERKVGIFNPECVKERTERNSRPVLFLYPDGGQVRYSSRAEAIRQTGISSSTLVRVLSGGYPVKQGKLKGVIIRPCE